jgi:hypothetical protein
MGVNHPSPEELRVLRAGLAAARDRKLRMWALPVDQIARLLATAEAHVLDAGARAAGDERGAQRRLVSALRVKAARTLKSCITEDFLAWLEGQDDPVAAVEK